MPALRGPRAKGFISLIERARGQQLPPDEILQAAVDAVARTMGTDVATLYILDSRAGELVLAATRGLPRSAVGFVTLKLGEGASGHAAASGAPVVAPDIALEPRFKIIPGFDQSRYRSILATPIVDGATTLGVLNVQTVEPHGYSARDIQDLGAIAVALAPRLRELLAGDLSLRLRGPSVLSEAEGVAVATHGRVEICQRLVERLRLLFPDARCTVALAPDDQPAESGMEALRLVLGDELRPAAQTLLERCLAQGSAHSLGSPEDGAILALPLSGPGGLLGALLIAAAARPSFGAYEAEYVVTLAAQVGMALERAAAGGEHGESARDVRDTFQRYDELTRMVLDDAGLDALIARVAELWRAPVAVIDAAGVQISGSVPESVQISADLCAGGSFLGRLIAGPSTQDSAFLSAAARIVALELAKWKTRFDVENRVRGDVLDMLVGGAWTDDGQVITRAGLAGIDLSRTYAPVMFAFVTTDLTATRGALALRAFQRVLYRSCGEPPVSVAFVRPEGILLLADPGARRGGLERAVAQALGELRRLSDGVAVGAGIGPACTQPAQYGAAYRQALMAAGLSQRVRSEQPIAAARLGAFRLLLALDDERPLREFVEDVLGPLLRQDTDVYGAELVKTLEAFHASGEALRPAAAALFIHVNTLKYRLARIQSLTGRELADPTGRLDLYLALYALRLLEPERDSLLPHNVSAAALSGADDAAQLRQAIRLSSR